MSCCVNSTQTSEFSLDKLGKGYQGYLHSIIHLCFNYVKWHKFKSSPRCWGNHRVLTSLHKDLSHVSVCLIILKVASFSRPTVIIIIKQRVWPPITFGKQDPLEWYCLPWGFGWSWGWGKSLSTLFLMSVSPAPSLHLVYGFIGPVFRELKQTPSCVREQFVAKWNVHLNSGTKCRPCFERWKICDTRLRGDTYCVHLCLIASV